MKISRNHIKLWRELRGKSGWFCVPDLASATGCSDSVIQRYLNFLVRLDLLEQMRTHPAPLYRLTTDNKTATAEAYIETISMVVSPCNT